MILAIATVAMGLCCARLIGLIAAIAPYLGWSWLIALAGGAMLLVIPIWALAAGLKSWPRQARWLSVGYAAAAVFAMQYYLPRHLTPPTLAKSQPLPAAPVSFDFQVAGLLSHPAR